MSLNSKSSVSGAGIDKKWTHDMYQDAKEPGPPGNGMPRNRKNNKYGDKTERQQVVGPSSGGNTFRSNKGPGTKPYQKNNKRGNQDEYVQKNQLPTSQPSLHNQSRGSQMKEGNSLDETTSSTPEQGSSGNIHYGVGKPPQHSSSQVPGPNPQGQYYKNGKPGGGPMGFNPPKQGEPTANNQYFGASVGHYSGSGAGPQHHNHQGYYGNQGAPFRDNREGRGNGTPNGGSSSPGNYYLGPEQGPYMGSGSTPKYRNEKGSSHSRKGHNNGWGTNGQNRYTNGRNGYLNEGKKDAGSFEIDPRQERSFFDERIRHTEFGGNLGSDRGDRLVSSPGGALSNLQENLGVRESPSQSAIKTEESFKGDGKEEAKPKESAAKEAAKSESEASTLLLGQFLFRNKKIEKILPIFKVLSLYLNHFWG